MVLLTPGCTPAPAPQLDPISALGVGALSTEALAAAGLLPAAGFAAGFTPATGKLFSLKAKIAILEYLSQDWQLLVLLPSQPMSSC